MTIPLIQVMQVTDKEWPLQMENTDKRILIKERIEHEYWGRPSEDEEQDVKREMY